FVQVLFCLLVLTSCKKEKLVEYDANYEGEWHSVPNANSVGNYRFKYLIIELDQGIFGQWCDSSLNNCSNVFSGPVKINSKGTKIYIGKVFKNNGRVNFDIDEPPHINSSGKWECTLT